MRNLIPNKDLFSPEMGVVSSTALALANARELHHEDIDISKEFFIEPKSDYPELFHKRIDLQYQHEMRIFILNAPSGGKGVVIPFEPISTDSGNFALGQLYLEGTATFKKKE